MEVVLKVKLFLFFWRIFFEPWILNDFQHWNDKRYLQKNSSRCVKPASCWRGPEGPWQKWFSKSEELGYPNSWRTNLPQIFLNIWCEYSIVKRMIFGHSIPTGNSQKRLKCFMCSNGKLLSWLLLKNSKVCFTCVLIVWHWLNQQDCHFEPMILRTNPLNVNQKHALPLWTGHDVLVHRNKASMSCEKIREHIN